jgi:dTDP-4-dehydrorhamnose 3,5-epimerase
MNQVLEYPSGVKLVEPARFRDARGCAEEVEFGTAIRRTLVVSSLFSVIRGIHFQDWRVAPLTKVLTVLRGRVEDSVFDLRQEEVEGAKFLLDGDRPQYLVIPPWCAHGYAVTSPYATVQYFFDAPRDEAAERVIHYLSLPVAWPAFEDGPILSEKDFRAPPAVQVLADLR